MIVTIDGPAAAGKGTLAARLAEKYKLAYFDTGMVYRAVGLEMFLNGEDVTDEVQAEKTAKELTFQKMTTLAKHPEFRGAVGGKNASIVSAHPKVRQALLKMQQDFAKKSGFCRRQQSGRCNLRWQRHRYGRLSRCNRQTVCYGIQRSSGPAPL